jgi:hypothetical protein
MAKGKRHTHVQILSLLRQIEIEPISLMRDSARAQPPMHSPTMEHEPLGRLAGYTSKWIQTAFVNTSRLLGTYFASMSALAEIYHSLRRS